MSFISRSSPPSIFPAYLLPALPFQRQKPSSEPTTSASSEAFAASTDAAANPGTAYLSGHTSYLRCGRCAVDLCLTSAIVSRGFTGRWGRAYLVSASSSLHGVSNIPQTTMCRALPNTHVHKAVPRQLVTGAHTVCDVSCAFCGNVLGWKYETCPDSQEYKVGKFILETKRVSVATYWEQDSCMDGDENPSSLSREALDKDIIEFDSQDEDECEDLFSGIWSPSLATKRRQAKRFMREL